MTANMLIAASAAVVGLLGSVHLLFTFRGNKMHPRDADLIARLKTVSPVISAQTTMWRAGLGFHASHSFGAMLFGLVFGYLALWRGEVLFGSWFLMALGAAFLAGWVVLARRYWFSVPFRGTVLALALYGAGVASHFL